MLRRRFAAVGISGLLAAGASAQGWLDTARWYVQPKFGEFHYLADFNGDGFDDLVLFSAPPTLPVRWTSFQVCFNDGLGDFPTHAAPVPLPISPTAFQPLDDHGLTRLGDVTGDGLPDVLLAEMSLSPAFMARAVRVYPGLGGGAFAEPVTTPLLENLDALTLGQADADPALEIAIVDAIVGSESTRWYDWNGAGFTASAEAFIFGSGSSPTAASLVALDLDGDGDDDLIFGQGHGQNLRRLDTVAGAPVVSNIYTIGSQSSNSLYPHVVDLIGGSAEDLLVVEVASTGAEFWLVPLLHVGSALVPGAKQHFTFSASGTVPGSSFAPCDWDQDGDPDLLAFAWQEPGQAVDAILALLENDGSDGFGSGPVAKANLMYAGSKTGLGVTDLDHDGHLDYVGPQSAYFGRSRFEESLAPITGFLFGSDPRHVADAEGDGDLDFFHKNFGARLNDATGGFPVSQMVPATPAGKLAAGCPVIGDLTGDGRVDFVHTWMNPPDGSFGSPTFAEMRLVVDDGLGHYVDGGTANSQPMSPHMRATCLVLDFDEDGDQDVWGTQDVWGVSSGFWPNDGAGHFATFSSLPLDNVEACAAGDLDGDGDTDLAANVDSAGVAVLLRTALLDYTTVVLHTESSGVDPDSITLADQDLDGDLDLSCATSWTDKLLLFANDGTGGFAVTDELGAGLSPVGEPVLAYHDFGDVDGDGVPDLLAGPKSDFQDGSPDKVGLYRGLPGGGFEPVRWYAGTAMGGVGDVDGDGDTDLLGRSVVRSRRFDGPDDGVIRQYGTGTQAGSGVAPVLGASGPLRPGSASAALHVRRAVGGAPALLLYSFGEAAVPGLPFASATLYVSQPFFTLLLFLGGTPGAQGEGTLDLGLTPVLPAVVGITVFHQLAVFGGPGKGKTVSNGLQLTYGF